MALKVATIEGIFISEIKRRRSGGVESGEREEWRRVIEVGDATNHPPDHETMPMLRAGLSYSSPSRFPEPFLAMNLQRSMYRTRNVLCNVT